MKRVVIALVLLVVSSVAFALDETVVVDAAAPTRPFAHFWEQMFGSGRAVLSLRESYRNDLRQVKRATGFTYVRFHAILHDDVGIYDEDKHGNAIYNFSWLDQIYDGLLANGVKPFVELSFMPKKLAASNIAHTFWDHANVAPPKDYAKWDALIAAFARHLVERYGIDEVASWYFEVWNEPNLDFWGGSPRQATYFTLYDHTARALKAVSPKLRVGGPSTAQAAWVAAFIRHCRENAVPLDFASTHVYANDSPRDVFGTDEPIARDAMVCRAVRKVHDEIKASALPDLPLIWSEFNASFLNEPEVTDAPYMGPWLADTIRQCDGLVDMMSYWTFSDVFDEQGVVKTPLYGGFGLIAEGGIPKPAFNAFKLLHRLGEQRLDVASDHVLATRKADGSLVLALWNYAAPGRNNDAPATITLQLKNSKASRALVSRVDATHGDMHAAYAAIGSPRYPTPVQLEALRAAAELPAPDAVPIRDGILAITLPAHGLALVELQQGEGLK
ncbi:MAG TPA: glycosyl hydrolase family 39 [Rudaea sp.]|jgi:xylan 1,4-beta-xylosidase